MTPRPVFVVGIGRAGCSMLSTIEEFVSVEGVEDHFQFLAVDSSSHDLHTFAPDTATTFELTIDREAYTDHRESLDYLQSEPELVPEAGTSRRRPLGRYLIDSNADSASLYECLFDQINSLSESHSNSNKLQVWVINSLGGGTGSGAFPLVSLLLQQCSDEVEGTVEIFGIGTLPRLDRLLDQINAPEDEPVHYANAYTALAELRKLMDIDGNTEYPIEINIDASPADVRKPSIAVDQNPFEGYWLLGFKDTNRFNGNTGSRMSRLAARLIFYLASTDANEWFHQGHIYSITGIAVEAPIEQLQQYQSLDQELDQLDDDLDTLRSRRESLKTAVDCIDSLLRDKDDVSSNDKNKIHFLSTSGESLPISKDLTFECEDLVPKISATAEMDGPQLKLFEKQVQNILEESSDQIPDNVPSERAVRFLCASKLRNQIRREIATHPLPNYLNELRNKWALEEIEEQVQPDVVESKSSHEVSFEKWRRTLLNELRDRKEKLQKRADQSIIPSFLSTPGQRLSEIEDDLERADRLVEHYETICDFEAELSDEIDGAHQQLKEQRRHLEQKIQQKQKEWEELQQHWARLSRRRSQLETSMRELNRQDGRVHVPLQFGQENIDGNQIESDFASLLSNGLLNKRDLRQSLEEAITSFDEPVEDLAESQFGKTTGQLGIMAVKSDHGLLEEILLDGADKSDSLQRELYYHFENVDEFISWNQVGSLYLLGFYSPLSLQYTSEFGTIHEYFTDPSADVSSLLQTISDSDLQQRFAYPELVNQSG